MSALALAAILGSAAIHAAWNALLKGAPDVGASSVAVSAGAAALTAVLGLAVGPWAVPDAAWPMVAAAGLVEGAYFVTLSRALTRLPLGTAYGVSRGAGLLFVWPLSVAVLGETATALEMFGAVLVSLGLFTLVRRGGSRAGLASAAACAASVGLYPVAYKAALERGASPYPLFALALAIALPVQVALLGDGRRQRLASALRGAPWRLGLASLLCAASFLLFLAALQACGAARLTGLRNTSVVFAAAFGWAQGEPSGARNVASALAIAAGALLLSGRV